MSDGDNLYQAHLTELRSRYAAVLERCGYATLVIAAGRPHPVFLDDQHLPFRANPHLLQWGPLHEHPGSVLVVSAGRTPRLLVHRPTDFWHKVPPVPALFDSSGLEVDCLGSTAAIAAELKSLPGPVAFIGEVLDPAAACGIERVNPAAVLEQLHEYRTVKTGWELANLRAASHIGVRGHLAAREAFWGGGSEYEIHLAFRSATGATDAEMPYPAIVALNDHAATLHYQRLERERGASLSLLIDAGHAVHGYASDITRTHSEDGEFGALIEAMHEVQRDLCAAALPGTDYRQLHHAAHQAIAGLLTEAGVLTVPGDTAVEVGLTRTFFPHGLGHFLGLQVHDVGALYQRREPGEHVPAGEDKHLRLTRTLTAGNIITVEPGIYFIAPLLDELRSKPEAAMVNWARVEELRPFGGIRIEDNLHITADGNENLTRSAFRAERLANM